MFDPLHQFAVTPDSAFSNLFFSALLTFVTIFLIVIVKFSKIPGYLQLGTIEIYLSIKQRLGKEAESFAPLMFSVFLYIAIANLLGLIPGIFPLTSHFTGTIALSLPLFIITVFNGLILHTKSFIGHFIIKGLPLPLQILIGLIEVGTFLLRPITLAMRLCVNVMVGHILCEVIAFLLSEILPVSIFIIPLLLFEMFMGVLQAYIFTTLACMHLKESAH